MNSLNEIQASKIRNQPHIEFQLRQFFFQYLYQNPVREFQEIPAEAGCRKCRHDYDKFFVSLSDSPFVECL